MNESTIGADASVEALKLYHMKLTLAYSSLLALHIMITMIAIVHDSINSRVQQMGNDRRDRC